MSDNETLAVYRNNVIDWVVAFSPADARAGIEE